MTFRRAQALAFGAILAALAPQVQAAGDQDPAVVATEYGKVRGALRDGTLQFRGIPYAAPPVGDLRFAMPQPPTPWTDIRDAIKYGPSCAQPARYGTTAASYTEDCLYLNVVEPSSAPGKKRPVIVWIYGGAFVGGGSNLYPVQYLARSADAVVISFNYRLGALGFIPYPAVKDDHNGGFGLEDQRAAMRWVKRNIAAFGGDPDNITLAGESAGAGSTCMHILAPDETTGLFNKAILESGACTAPLRNVAEAAEKYGKPLTEKVGCGKDDGPATLKCLRDAKVEDLIDNSWTEFGSDITAFVPTWGNLTVPEPGQKALESGKYVKVPVINGGDRDELRLYVAYEGDAKPVTQAQYEAAITAMYGADKLQAILAQYPLKDYSSAAAAFGTVESDYNPQNGLNHCSYLQTDKLMAKSAPVYAYVFGDRNAPPVMDKPGMEMGAVHSSELPYQFPHFDNTQELSTPDLAPASQKLAGQMMTYWSSFVQAGRPNGAHLPDWPRYSSDRTVMRFEPGVVGMFDAGAAHKCGFWKTLYPDALTE